MGKLISSSGFALILGGLFFVITNVVISPLVDFEASFSEVLTSSEFFYRMISAALTVAFLLYGSIGLYLYHGQLERGVLFRLITFILTFFGTAFVFANEWHQIFVLPEIAKVTPEGIEKFDATDNLVRYWTGGILAIMTFSVGWLSFMVSLLLAGKLKRLGPVLVLTGYFAIPLGSAFLSPVWGGMLGSICFAIGFCSMGAQLIRSD